MSNEDFERMNIVNANVYAGMPKVSERTDLIRDIIGLLRCCGTTDLWVLRRFVSAYTKQGVWKDE